MTDKACKGGEPVDAGAGYVTCRVCGALVRRDRVDDPTFGFAATCEYEGEDDEDDDGDWSDDE